MLIYSTGPFNIIMSGPPIKVIFVLVLVLSLSIMGFWTKRAAEAEEREAWKEYDLILGANYHINGLDLTINTSVPEYPSEINVYDVKSFKLSPETARARIESVYPGVLSGNYTIVTNLPYQTVFRNSFYSNSNAPDKFTVLFNGALIMSDHTHNTTSITSKNESDVLLLAKVYMMAHGVDPDGLILTRVEYRGWPGNSSRFLFEFAQLIDGHPIGGGVPVDILSDGSVYTYIDGFLDYTKVIDHARVHPPGKVVGQINGNQWSFCRNGCSVGNISLVYYLSYESKIKGTLRPAWEFALYPNDPNLPVNNYPDYAVGTPITLAFDAETLRPAF